MSTTTSPGRTTGAMASRYADILPLSFCMEVKVNRIGVENHLSSSSSIGLYYARRWLGRSSAHISQCEPTSAKSMGLMCLRERIAANFLPTPCQRQRIVLNSALILGAVASGEEEEQMMRGGRMAFRTWPPAGEGRDSTAFGASPAWRLEIRRARLDEARVWLEGKLEAVKSRIDELDQLEQEFGGQPPPVAAPRSAQVRARVRPFQGRRQGRGRRGLG
jgi:hypothetical protein